MGAGPAVRRGTVAKRLRQLEKPPVATERFSEELARLPLGATKDLEAEEAW